MYLTPLNRILECDLNGVFYDVLLLQFKKKAKAHYHTKGLRVHAVILALHRVSSIQPSTLRVLPSGSGDRVTIYLAHLAAKRYR